MLLLTSYGTSAEICRALDAGASGAMLKGESNEALLEAIDAVVKEQVFISPEISAYLKRNPAPPPLTERQRQTLIRAAAGKSNAVIAAELNISADAVKQHLNAVYQKLGADNRAEAVTIAAQRGML